MYFGLTTMHVLLGAGLAAHVLGAGQVAWLILISACCHVHIFLGNDVADLELDATHPRRVHGPLVKGLRGEGVSKKTGLALTFAAAAAAFLLTAALGGSGYSMLALLAAFLGIGAYNVWGKVCPVPPVTDAAQALGWWGLVFYGAWFANPSLPFEELWDRVLPLLAFSMGFTLLTTGIEGGLRDIVNDQRHRKITTALILGASPLDGAPAGSREAKSSRAIVVYSFAIVFAMFGPSVAFLQETAYFASAAWHRTAVLATASVFVANVYLLWRAVKPIEPQRETWIRASAVVVLMPSLCLYLPSSLLAAELKWLIALLFFAPLAITQAFEEYLARLERAGEAPPIEFGVSAKR